MANLIFFSSTFKGCNTDLSIGIDISTPTRQVLQKLQALLPELMRRLASLSNISCSGPGPISTMFRHLVPGSNGQLIFDSGFEKYSEEVIQKLLIHQTVQRGHMDTEFLRFLGANAVGLFSAEVKVVNAEKTSQEAIRQSWRDKAFVTEVS